MFTYDDFNGTTRHGKLQTLNINTGQRLTVYCDWVYIKPKLEELR